MVWFVLGIRVLVVELVVIWVVGAAEHGHEDIDPVACPLPPS